MPTIDEYIDRAKERGGYTSDRQLSVALGMAGPALNMWRTKRSWPSDERMIALATIAGLPVEQALCDLNIWRAKSEPTRAMYSKIRDQLAQLAVLLCVVFAAVAGPTGTERAQAAIRIAETIHYANYTVIRTERSGGVGRHPPCRRTSPVRTVHFAP